MIKAEVLHRDEVQIPLSRETVPLPRSAFESFEDYQTSVVLPDWREASGQKSNSWGNGRAYVPSRAEVQNIRGGGLEPTTSPLRGVSALFGRLHSIKRRLTNIAQSRGGTAISLSLIALCFGLSPLMIHYSADEVHPIAGSADVSASGVLVEQHISSDTFDVKPGSVGADH